MQVMALVAGKGDTENRPTASDEPCNKGDTYILQHLLLRSQIMSSKLKESSTPNNVPSSPHNAGSQPPRRVHEAPERLQRAQLASRLALLCASATLTLQVANARPADVVDLDAVKKAAAGKGAKAAAEALKAAKAAAKATLASDPKAVEQRSRHAVMFLEVRGLPTGMCALG